MIGQTKLLDKIDKLVQNQFPRFTMLVGNKGSGKKLICREIANKLGYQLVSVGVTVDEVREVIANSYSNTEPIVYVIPDTDKMSVPAKNALLKITEEPPQKAYFILTVTDLYNTLPTLKSRACVLNMDAYTTDDLRAYMRSKYGEPILCNDYVDFVVNTATVPQEIDTLMSYDIQEFKKFVDSVCLNLHHVNSANAFKVENQLALKKDEDKWDVLLFVQAIRQGYWDLFREGYGNKYSYCYVLACELIKELKYKNSVNKQYCLDQFILDIRKCWREQ